MDMPILPKDLPADAIYSIVETEDEMFNDRHYFKFEDIVYCKETRQWYQLTKDIRPLTRDCFSLLVPFSNVDVISSTINTDIRSVNNNNGIDTIDTCVDSYRVKGNARDTFNLSKVVEIVGKEGREHMVYYRMDNGKKIKIFDQAIAEKLEQG